MAEWGKALIVMPSWAQHRSGVKSQRSIPALVSVFTWLVSTLPQAIIAQSIYVNIHSYTSDVISQPSDKFRKYIPAIIIIIIIIAWTSHLHF